MSALTKMPPIKNKIFYFREGKKTYAIPKQVAEQYCIASPKHDNATISAQEVFRDLNERYTRPGALLKGLRARENLNQTEFAKIIEVTQANLSKMENGKRPIGKIIAKRIEQVFQVNYKYFLE